MTRTLEEKQVNAPQLDMWGVFLTALFFPFNVA